MGSGYTAVAILAAKAWLQWDPESDNPTGRVDTWGSKALHIDLLNRTRTTETPVAIQDHHFWPSGPQPHQLLVNYPSATNLCTSLPFAVEQQENLGR